QAEGFQLRQMSAGGAVGFEVVGEAASDRIRDGHAAAVDKRQDLREVRTNLEAAGLCLRAAMFVYGQGEFGEFPDRQWRAASWTLGLWFKHGRLLAAGYTVATRRQSASGWRVE